MEPLFRRRDRLLQAVLMRVRPAPLAEAIKGALGVRRRILETPDGRFLVDPVSVLALHLARTGSHEPGLRQVLRERLGPGDTFVDVGANEGYFSVLAGRLVGPAGQVVAVEPQARLLPVLRRNLELNALTNVRTVEAALADRPGVRTLHLSPGTNSGASGFVPRTRYALPTVNVPALTLSELLEDAGLGHVHLLKIDVEGAEHEVLAGGRDVLAGGRVGAVVLDVHTAALAAQGVDPEEPRRLLQELGFRRAPDTGTELWLPA